LFITFQVSADVRVFEFVSDLPQVIKLLFIAIKF